MARMSDLESLFCRTPPWRWFARRIVVPRVASGDFGPKVLEIGCGSGEMAAEVLRTHPEISSYTATDVDPAMIDAATRRLASFGARATTQTVSASGLPFNDAAFDTACSWLMLHHTIEWERVVTETVRVIRPGGTLIGYDLPDTRLGRGLHVITRSAVRMIAPSDLTDHLRSLNLADVRVEPVLAGRAFRFSAIRTQPVAT